MKSYYLSLILSLLAVYCQGFFLLPASTTLSSITDDNQSILRSIQTRIVNGQTSQPGQIPYQALLVISLLGGRSAVCGGSLISNEWVITAAHCAVEAAHFQVHLGAQSFKNLSEPGRVIIETGTKVIHPRYNPTFASNDVALIKLPQPVNLTDRIQPIKLPRTQEKFQGVKVVASGWGLQSDSSQQVAPELQFAHLQVITKRECLKTYNPLVITSSVICARGSVDGAESVCKWRLRYRFKVTLTFWTNSQFSFNQ